MTPTVEALARAINQLGSEEPLSREIRQDLLDRLAELGMVHVDVDSAPVLTTHGRKTYSAIIEGDVVSELEFDLPESD